MDSPKVNTNQYSECSWLLERFSAELLFVCVELTSFLDSPLSSPWPNHYSPPKAIHVIQADG